MKTQAECWQAVLDGKTLASERWADVHLKDGLLVNNAGKNIGYTFLDPEEWSIKPETKTVTEEQLKEAMTTYSGAYASQIWDRL